MRTNLGASALAVILSCASASPGWCEEWPFKLKIGVLTDLSGSFADFAGRGSVVATQMAVEDCLTAECKGMQIDVVSADHQNKADIALGIARKWVDTENVDALGDVVNAAVQLAVQSLAREKQSFAVLFPGARRASPMRIARRAPPSSGCGIRTARWRAP